MATPNEEAIGKLNSFLRGEISRRRHQSWVESHILPKAERTHGTLSTV